MQIMKTPLCDAVVITPTCFYDARGWFIESWSKKTMEQAGLFYEFVQDNHSASFVQGTLRGLHYQKGSSSQAKLVRCIKGSVLDVAVDLRKGSPSYKKWTSVLLSEDNMKQFLIPRGFAHGFVTLTPDVEFLYKADNYYDPSSEGSILWNDPELAICWGIDAPILSAKDAAAPLFCESDADFIYKEI